jgi:hypothetical protein
MPPLALPTPTSSLSVRIVIDYFARGMPRCYVAHFGWSGRSY